MNKPDSLRAHLLASVPGLKKNTERLLMFIDNGKVRCTAAASLSFEYTYSLQIILTDFAGHPDTVMLPILAWVRVNQSELLVNLEKSEEGLKFEADIIDNTKVDMSISLPLTERVLLTRQDDGTFKATHPGESLYEPEDTTPVEIYADNELISAWQPPLAPDGTAMAVWPHG